MKSFIATGFVLIAVMAAAPAQGAGPGAGSDADSAKRFVQDFYTWYLKEEKEDHDVALDDFAIQAKPKWFSAAIIQGLKEDEAAQAKSPDEVVGLDSDPFLNSQENCEPYKTGKVTAAGNGYQVEVFGQCPDANSKQADVIAVVEKHDGAWVFVNFLYPGNGDLLSVLEALKKERETPLK